MISLELFLKNKQIKHILWEIIITAFLVINLNFNFLSNITLEVFKTNTKGTRV